MSDREPGFDFDPEKMAQPFVDDDYGTRKGYDPQFLGIPVPLPRIADESIAAGMDDGSGCVVPYEHFSVVMHGERRLALVTAANVDGSKEAKEPEPGRDYSRGGLAGLGRSDVEKWVTEPRLDARFQLPDSFYTKDRGNFDKGHIVRRDDVAWGADYDEVRRANGDTFHVTNCSPQVDAFNRANLRGEWGRLENYVLKQAKTERLCVFSGPILDGENDKTFRGRDDAGEVEVQIPARFWKLVVARAESELEAFAFLLEQDLTDTEVEFDVDAEWQAQLISISDLEQLIPDLEFDDAIRQADQFAASTGEDLRREGGLDRHGTPPGGHPSMPDTVSKTDPATDVSADTPIWDDATSPLEIQRCFAAGDRGQVEALLDALISDLDRTGRAVDATAAKQVLAELRKHAWFSRLEQVAAKLSQCAVDDVQVQRQLAQARIELGQITEAVEGLLHLKQKIETDLDDKDLSVPNRETLKSELGETLGLLGRAYKQYYVNARPSAVEPRLHDADASPGYYTDAYARGLGDFLWQAGINSVVLLTHRDRIAKGDRNAISDAAAERASGILDVIDAKAELMSWGSRQPHRGQPGDREHVRRRRGDQALPRPGRRVQRAEHPPPADRPVAAHRRPAPGRRDPADVQRSRLAELGGGPGAIPLNPAKAGSYEKVWGQTGYKSLRWLSQAFERAAPSPGSDPTSSKVWAPGSCLTERGSQRSGPGNTSFSPTPTSAPTTRQCRHNIPTPNPPDPSQLRFSDPEPPVTRGAQVQGMIWTSPTNRPRRHSARAVRTATRGLHSPTENQSSSTSVDQRRRPARTSSAIPEASTCESHSKTTKPSTSSTPTSTTKPPPTPDQAAAPSSTRTGNSSPSTTPHPTDSKPTRRSASTESSRPSQQT